MKLSVIKNIARPLNIYTKENKRCYVSFPILYMWSLLSRGNQRALIKLCVTFRWPLKSEGRTYTGLNRSVE